MDSIENNYRKYTEHELELINYLAKQTATAIRNYYLLKELSAINKISNELSKKNTIDIQAINNVVIKYADRLIKDGNFYIAIYNKNTDSFKITFFIDEKEDSKHINQEEMIKGLTNYIKLIGKPKLFKRLEIDKLIKKGEIILVGPKAKVWMGVPLFEGNRIFGVIAAQNYESENYYNEYDLLVLSSISSQISTAYTNSRLRKLEYSLKTSKSYNEEQSLKIIAKQIIREIRYLVEYKNATIQIIEGNYRRIVAYAGFKKNEIDYNLLGDISKDKLIMRVINSIDYKPLVIPDTSLDPDWISPLRTKDVKSWIGIPLVFNKKVIGIITLDHYIPNYYSDYHSNSLLHFAYNAVNELNNAKMQQNQARNLKIVEGIAKSLDTQLDINTVLNTLMQEVQSNLKCKHCTIFLPYFDKDKTILKPIANSGFDAERISTRSFIVDSTDEGIAGFVYKTG
ncbi:GAF domain-containing protein [bacterium]|nr:MAG: GAF domain-containing protein [bacterium]